MEATKERGAAAVEFALIVPLLVLFLMGIVEAGTRYAQQASVNHWAFLVARDIALDPTQSATTLVNGLKGSDTHAYTPSVTGDCHSNTTVRVSITSSRPSVTGIFGSYTLDGQGVARCE